MSPGQGKKARRQAIRKKGKRPREDPRVRSFVRSFAFRFVRRRNRVATSQTGDVRADIFNETPIVRCVW